MIKKFFKGLGLFVFLIAVAALSWLASYYATTKANEHFLASEPNLSKSVEVFAEDAPEKPKNSIAFEYYIVRLEGEKLNIYTCADNSEEFLYSEDIITANLTKTDIEMLKRGNVLYTTAELTEFMENFVS